LDINFHFIYLYTAIVYACNGGDIALIKKLKDRYNILAIFFVLFGCIIVYQLADLQIVQGGTFYEKSQRRVTKERTVTAQRGNIMDRFGVPIAVNRQGFTVQIVKAGLNNAQLNDVVLRLTYIFDKNGDNYIKSLGKYLTFNPVTFGKRTQGEIKWWQKNVLGLKESQIMTTPEELFKYLRDTRFKIDSKYTDEQAYRIMTIRYEILINEWYFNIGNPINLAKDVDMKTVAEVEEKHHDLQGVITSVEPVRKYMDAKYEAQVIGYVRGINSEQYEKLKDKGYGSNDIIGQTGIEAVAEEYLRGKDGLKKVEVDTSGRLTEVLDENPAIPGNDVVLTIDANLQKVAMESLERNINRIRQMGGRNNFGDADAGAAVAIDVNTGEILAMASYPSYDPTIFLEDASNAEAQKTISKLFSDKSSPSLNRTIQGAYAPGSTFKPLVAVAGLEEGIITPDTPINDRGKISIGGMDFFCLEYKNGLGAHGKLTLARALATSCNIYFHELGYMTTIDKIEKWARYFGLGQKTGVELGNESNGILATKKYKSDTFKDAWRPADTAQASIGQLYNTFTPLQLANYVSTLANGGKRFKPHIIKKIMSYDGKVVKEIKPEFEQVPIKPENIDAVKKGMIAVTNSEDGTAVEVFRDFPFMVAGKTGTAETGHESNQSSNALFVSYAPADKPQIAVAVVVEKGVWGGNTAPIAKDILEAYFNIRNKGNDDKIEFGEGVLTR
jgi:penicillin-binding protein 2